jgi:hypothetical protein
LQAGSAARVTAGRWPEKWSIVMSTKNSAERFRGRKAIAAGAVLALLIGAALIVQHHESVANFVGAAHERTQDNVQDSAQGSAHDDANLGGDLPASIGSAFTPVLW